MPMKPKEFWEKVSQWGSFMTNGDPGACLYGFDERGLVQSEGHRRDCIEHLDTACRKAADANVAAGDDPQDQHPEIDALIAYLRTAPVEGSMPELDEFTQAYVEAALFFTTDFGGEDDEDQRDDALSESYGPAHIEAETLARMRADCARFQELYGSYLTDENYTGRSESGAVALAGHDFWLTRAGHGAGFWDGDWADPVGDFLTEASKSFGEMELYVGDDGLIHGSGGRTDPAPVEPPASSPKP